MLIELSIRDFAIIDELNLVFGPGFSVLTGETGAGKSIIIDGLDLLLGGRADSTMVRTGAQRAQIEGVFAIPTTDSDLVALLQQEQLQGDDADRLVLAREVRSSGRSATRVNGHIVNLGLLRQVTSGLVDIHGQSEHLCLLRVREHINLLDRYGGLEAQRDKVSRLVRRLHDVRSELKQLLHDERELARKLDLLSYQIDEIRRAALQPGEEESLQEERTRLANAAQLSSLVDEAYTYLEGQSEEMPTIQDLVGHVVRALVGLARIDTGQVSLRQAAEQISFQLNDLSNAMREYRDQIEFNPGRLAAVEERIEAIRRLQRKYGDSIEDILDYAERAAAELDAIGHSEERIIELEQQQDRLLREIGQMGAELSEQRRVAGATMAAAVEQELADLRMSGARFGVDISWRADPNGAVVPEKANNLGLGNGERVAFDGSGLDQVEFLISPNPGEPLKPMVKIASGGETSRLMLAIKTVLSRADQTPTLVFDEIDQGIGGRVGQTVGQKLWGLSQGRQEGRQVICVTHLPQLAGFGDAHYSVTKQLVEGRTMTRVHELRVLDNRVTEIALMLGGDSPATRESAREILDQVRQHKRFA